MFEKKLRRVERVVRKIIPDTVKRDREFASSFWKKGDYAATIKSTIKYFNNEASIRVFDNNRNVISENEIRRNSIVSCIFALD